MCKGSRVARMTRCEYSCARMVTYVAAQALGLHCGVRSLPPHLHIYWSNVALGLGFSSP